GDLALRPGVDADEAVVARDRAPVRNRQFADATETDMEIACVVPARLLSVDGHDAGGARVVRDRADPAADLAALGDRQRAGARSADTQRASAGPGRPRSRHRDGAARPRASGDGGRRVGYRAT